MDEAGMEKQAQRWGMIAGALVALFLLHRWRQRRKVKKILKARAKVRAREEEAQRKEARGRAAKRRGKKKGKERSLVEQLVRFALFQFLKKVISEQIKQMEIELGKGKLGKKLVEATEQA